MQDFWLNHTQNFEVEFSPLFLAVPYMQNEEDKNSLLFTNKNSDYGSELILAVSYMWDFTTPKANTL